jgi:hypothetical protein
VIHLVYVKCLFHIAASLAGESGANEYLQTKLTPFMALHKAAVFFACSVFINIRQLLFEQFLVKGQQRRFGFDLTHCYPPRFYLTSATIRHL